MSSNSPKLGKNSPRSKAWRLFWTIGISLVITAVVIPSYLLHRGGSTFETSLRGVGGTFVSLEVHKQDLPQRKNLEKGTTSYVIKKDGTADIVADLPGNVERLDVTFTIDEAKARALTVEPETGETQIVWADASNWTHLSKAEEWNGLFLRRTETAPEDGEVDPRTIPYTDMATIDGSSLGEAVVSPTIAVSEELRGTVAGELVLFKRAPVISATVKNSTGNSVSAPSLYVDDVMCEQTNTWSETSLMQPVVYNCPTISKGVHAFTFDMEQEGVGLQDVNVENGGVRMQEAEFEDKEGKSSETCIFVMGDRVRVKATELKGIQLNSKSIEMRAGNEQRAELPEEDVYELCVHSASAHVRVEKGWFVWSEQDAYRLPLRKLETFINNDEQPAAILSHVGLEQFSKKRDHVIEIPIQKDADKTTTIFRVLDGSLALTDIRMTWHREPTAGFSPQDEWQWWIEIWKHLIKMNDNDS